MVIKSLALSKINNLILALPNPSEKIEDIQDMFYNYLWDKGPDELKRCVVCQNYYKGGLRMVDVKIFMESLKLTWIHRILLKTNKYFTVITELYTPVQIKVLCLVITNSKTEGFG